MGRTALWGLAADGADGDAPAKEIKRDDVRKSMGLCRRNKIDELNPDLIVRAD